jgi:hypothetical protein
MPSALDRGRGEEGTGLTHRDLSMAVRMWAAFAAALMSISALVLLTFCAGGIPFSGTAFFTTFAAAWILPTVIAFLVAPFLLCYFSQAITDILIVFGVIFFVFSVFECASAWYVAVGPPASSSTILLSVIEVLCTMVNLLGASAFLILVAVLRSNKYLNIPARTKTAIREERQPVAEADEEAEVEMVPLRGRTGGRGLGSVVSGRAGR